MGHFRFGRNAVRKRVILLGQPEDTDAVERQLAAGNSWTIQLIARRGSLPDTSAERLTELLHETSACKAHHSPAGDVWAIEQAIQACELGASRSGCYGFFSRPDFPTPPWDELAGHPVSRVQDGTRGFLAGVDQVGQGFHRFPGAALSPVPVPFALRAARADHLSRADLFPAAEWRGFNGNPFTMLKFRTMVTNAEQLKQELEQLERDVGAGLQGDQ